MQPSKSRATSGLGLDSYSPANSGRSSFGRFMATSNSSLSYLSEPPDLTKISDANIAVSLKSLSKNHGTTKVKALEELVAFARARPFVEDPVLEAWTNLYPRTCIDNSRRVRELAHVLQLELMKSARKRMEKYTPRIVGAWLAGAFDKDRVVARTVEEGLASFLQTEAKVVQFWKRCHSEILEYAVGAIRESPDTLSDERSTTKEEAEAKYHRVLSGGLSLVHGLLVKLTEADAENHMDSYSGVFAATAFWNSATSSDAFVRKTAYGLLRVWLDKQERWVEDFLPRLTQALIRDGLTCNQTGSVLEYLRLLITLTNKHPGVWPNKPSPLTLLRPFIEKGSQGSATNVKVGFWQYLNILLDGIPKKSISLSVAAEVTLSLRTGISHKEEPRSNAVYAWKTYLSTVVGLTNRIQAEKDQMALLEGSVYPLFEHYMQPTAGPSCWSSGMQLPIQLMALSTLLKTPMPDAIPSAAREWGKMAKRVKTRIRMSPSETSDDYERSQEAIAEAGRRWFALMEKSGSEIDSAAADPSTAGLFIGSVVRRPSIDLLNSAADLLAKESYKPFGAASLIASAFKLYPDLISEAWESVASSLFPVERPWDLAVLLDSPSAHYMLACLAELARLPDFTNFYALAYGETAETLAALDNEKTPALVLELVRGSDSASSAHQSTLLQDYLKRVCLACAQGHNDAWELFEATAGSHAMTEATSISLAQDLTDLMSPADANIDQGRVLRAMELMTSNMPRIFADNETLQMNLTTKLLSAMGVSDTATTTRATAIWASVREHSTGESTFVKLIQDNLDNAGPDSLEIGILVEQASILARSGSVPLEQLFPSTNIWASELRNFICERPDPSLSLVSSLGGAYFLLDGSRRPEDLPFRRDQKGYSIPARMALFTTRVLSSGTKFLSLPQAFQEELLFMLYLMTEVSSDQLAIWRRNNPWTEMQSPENRPNVEDFVSSTRKALRGVVTMQRNLGEGKLVDKLITTMLRQSKLSLGPWAIYSARALSEILQAVVDSSGFTKSDEALLANLDTTPSPSTVLGVTAVIAGYGDALSSSPTISTLCNRLISDVVSIPPEGEHTMIVLALLNACMSIYPVGKLPVAMNRMVMAVKQITTWFDKHRDSLDAKLAAESCRTLQRLLPCIKEVYGSQWDLTVQFCLHLWDRAADAPAAERLPYTHASLKLMSTLQAISSSNDDLDDALRDHYDSKAMFSALVGLLRLPHMGDSQPEEIVEKLLSRMATKIPSGYVNHLELYSLLASDSRDIQSAASSLLEKELPPVIQRLSEEILLQPEDAVTGARLPHELLSLLLDAPTLEAYPEDILSKFPTPVRSYLLSWRLIFVAFDSASLRVRNDFVSHLKEADLVGPLLDFMFDWLGHSASHALDLDKEGFTDSWIKAYDMDLADVEIEEKNMNWLLVHIYYLTLKFAPALFKTWYFNCKSKQTKVAVLAWTEKYFSRILISETLDEVQKWADEQTSDDEQELQVKVNKVAREVVAGYEIDDLTAMIVIKLPTTYPIETVVVNGMRRVAASEKKWNSWIMNTQGVITYSNGSIVDGLIAFRRNVFGALKGQSECAICYSIVSEDKKMPDKRCGTCKNQFHRYCLYKWFQSSGHNKCPLCRNPIDYLGADSNRRGRPQDE